GQPVRLPAKTTSFRQWAVRLQEHARSPLTAEELTYWRDTVGRPSVPLPLDFSEDVNDEGSVETVHVQLGAAETSALLCQGGQTTVPEVLLATLAAALVDWRGEGGLLIDVEGHGRGDLSEGIDLSRTVGWFTALYPLYLEAKTGDCRQQLRTVREQW